ncbi:MAG: hypothetical protein UV05_C0050G0004 [candidate division CPR1 bacterium GW2011_GWA2_42_17]|uniref:Uncharacterized protein n=1 Tax=candidate division CPR1 bacterium GW2011_GWA2_42_17 TaxID=1618341 RepID=A0A0G1BWW2_9BACT|nr:MAG: hypothetical protein UV05_C0050G0004 [candidate division CPR1 bacterium GW2011_GWA2_42_17]
MGHLSNPAITSYILADLKIKKSRPAKTDRQKVTDISQH